MNLYNAYVTPVIDYCIEIWAVQPNSKLEVIQNKINRLFYEFFVSNKNKKAMNSIKDGNYNNIVLDIFLQFKILTIMERQKWFIIKRVMKTYYKVEKCEEFYQMFDFNQSHGSRGIPKLQITRPKTEKLKKSLRGCA